MARLFLLAAVLASCSGLVDAEETWRSPSQVTDVSGLESLVNQTWGGGHYEQVGDSQFYFLELNHTSGVHTSEVFIYEGAEDNLRLRLHLAPATSVWRKAEWSNGTLVISERLNREDEWRIFLEFYSKSPLRGR